MFTYIRHAKCLVLGRKISRSLLFGHVKLEGRSITTTCVVSRKSTIKKIKEQITEDEVEDVHDPIFDTSSIMARLRGGIKDHGENIFIIQPDYKWGKDRHLTKLLRPRLDEAVGLVESITNWKVVESAFASVHEQNPIVFFGTGRVAELGNEIQELRKNKGVTSVFLNTGILSSKQVKALEELWRCRVFDRYRIVLEIFKMRAQTKEAKLQVKMAEVQYLRSHLTSEHGKFDQQKGGSMSISGGGETQLEKDRRQLSAIEEKLKKGLKQIKEQRGQKRLKRWHSNFPIVALIGYTNAGKTSLARALARDFSLIPEDKLFATLDTTIHRGKLASSLPVLFIDTVGFISDLPHQLVDSFSATLEDVKNADLLVHVRDVTHPEHDLQNSTVLDVCKKLNIREELIDNMIYADNKLDISPKWSFYFSSMEEERKNFPKYNTDNVIGVCATSYVGLHNLRATIEKKLFQVMKKEISKITVPADGEELRWLHHEATVLETLVNDDGTFTLDVVTDSAILGKYKKKFRKDTTV